MLHERNIPKECLKYTLIFKLQILDQLIINCIHLWKPAVVNCSCYNHGVLEVKYPFTCKDKDFLSVAYKNSIFYKDDNEELKLKTDHACCYQVQNEMQMKFAHAQNCDY